MLHDSGGLVLAVSGGIVDIEPVQDNWRTYFVFNNQFFAHIVIIALAHSLEFIANVLLNELNTFIHQ